MSSFQDVALDETREMILDETREMPNPQALVEDATWARLQLHAADITEFSKELEGLRKPGSGLADLRRVVEQAVQLQARIGLPRELLTRDLLLQAGVPVEALEQARSVLTSIAACERALEEARSHLEASTCQPSAVDDFACHLEAWGKFKQLSDTLQAQRERTPVAAVDLHMERRKLASSQLCSALLDKISGEEAHRQQLQTLLSQDWVQQELASLDVEVPGRPSLPSAFSGPDASPTPPVSPGAASLNRPVSFPVATSNVDTTANFGVQDLPGVASAGPTSGPMPTPAAAQMAVPSEGAEWPSIEWPASDQMPQPHPESQMQQRRLSEQQQLEQQQLDQQRQQHQLEQWKQQQQQQQQQEQDKQRQHGTPELWQAVHVGNEQVVKMHMEHGACDGRTKDASGHSVLWHAVAFNHLGLAGMMMEAFPHGSETGIDVSEVHPRRGDTLLHLLCSSGQFGAEHADIFKKIAAVAPSSVFEQVNSHGQSFLHIASASLNFWVLKFTCLNHPVPIKALVCSEKLAPLRSLADAIPKPSPPGATASASAFPAHFALAGLLSHDASGKVPFADVAFDVGRTEDEDGDDSSRGRFLAHRVVVAAQSPVLLKELEKLPVQELPKEGVSACIFRVDPRISKDVWRSILQFLYTGNINSSFQGNAQAMVELLRACAMYKLPKCLLDYAQTAIFGLLPASPPSLALQVFSITAGSGGEDIDVRAAREASTYILLRSAPQTLSSMEPKEVSKVLQRMIETAEQSVFAPSAAASTASATPNGPDMEQAARQQAAMAAHAAMAQQGMQGRKPQSTQSAAAAAAAAAQWNAWSSQVSQQHAMQAAGYGKGAANPAEVAAYMGAMGGTPAAYHSAAGMMGGKGMDRYGRPGIAVGGDWAM